MDGCWVVSVAWWMSMSRCLQSSFTTSIHLFLGLPCLLVSCTYPWSASVGYLVWTILCTSPKYCICRCCMRVLRPGVDQPYHTPLYSWSCLCELLLQFSSNRTFQIPVICFPVFASKYKFQSCTSTHWVAYHCTYYASLKLVPYYSAGIHYLQTL